MYIYIYIHILLTLTVVLYIINVLLLFAVGIVYNTTGSSVNVAISILFHGENISFDARLVTYLLHGAESFLRS